MVFACFFLGLIFSPGSQGSLGAKELLQILKYALLRGWVAPYDKNYALLRGWVEPKDEKLCPLRDLDCAPLRYCVHPGPGCTTG